MTIFLRTGQAGLPATLLEIQFLCSFLVMIFRLEKKPSGGHLDLSCAQSRAFFLVLIKWLLDLFLNYGDKLWSLKTTVLIDSVLTLFSFLRIFYWKIWSSFWKKGNYNTNIEEISILTISSYNITDHNNFRINSSMEWSERGENLFQN